MRLNFKMVGYSNRCKSQMFTKNDNVDQIKGIYSQYLGVLFPSAEKNTGKTGECVVSAGTRSGAHKKSFSKIYFMLSVEKFSTLNFF